MRYHNIFGFYLLFAVTNTTAKQTGADSSTIETPRDGPTNTVFHFHHPRAGGPGADDPGDIQCDLHDNSPSTSALRNLARVLISEFPLDNKEIARQGSLIHKCSKVLQSKVEGDGSVRIEICAGYRVSALRLKIGRDMLRLADKCSVERNGFQRTQGWVGYRNWGRFQAIPM